MKDETMEFICKVSRMGENVKILWIPNRFHKNLPEGCYVKVNMRKLM